MRNSHATLARRLYQEPAKARAKEGEVAILFPKIDANVYLFVQYFLRSLPRKLSQQVCLWMAVHTFIQAVADLAHRTNGVSARPEGMLRGLTFLNGQRKEEFCRGFSEIIRVLFPKRTVRLYIEEFERHNAEMVALKKRGSPPME